MVPESSLPYPETFLGIQLNLAQKIADLAQEPFDEIVLRFTALYRILGLDWSFDPANPVWQQYMQGLRQATDAVDFTRQYYLQRFPAIPTFVEEEHWGCFAFDYHANARRVKIHFSNQDDSLYGPLSHQRIEVRKAELRAMFQAIQQRHPEAQLVRGGSWLYNWEAYRRLFPPAFGASAQPQTMPNLQGRNIWGQFLRRGGKVHDEMVAIFLRRVDQLARVEDYPRCFPCAVLTTEAPISSFYAFYGI